MKENIKNKEEEFKGKEEKKIKEILSQYKNGIESIFKDSNFEETDGNYLIIIFKCPQAFYLKYKDINNQTLNQSLNLKLYSEEEKKIYFAPQKKFDDENIDINFDVNWNKYVIRLYQIFEKFFGSNLYLLELLIENYFNLKNNKEFEYEDFILIFCSIIKYYSELDISLELTNSENYLMIYIFGNDESYTKICGMLNYSLQLNPIAINYEDSDSNLQKKANRSEDVLKNIEIIDYDDKEPLLKSFYNKIENYQFEDYDLNNPVFWPPYFSYKPDKDDKFRKYEKNDDFVYSKGDDLNNEIDSKYYSKFRNIDKLRFIQRILNQIIKFSELKKVDIFEMMLFKRNNK